MDAKQPPDVFARRNALEAEHARVMQRLCEQLARDRGLGPFGELSDQGRDYLACDATTMCRHWDSDQALRDSHEAGKNAAVDLVAEQYRISQQIMAAENEAISEIGAKARAPQ